MPNNHPLHETFMRVNQLSQYIRASLGARVGSDWVSPCELFAPDSIQLDALIARVEKQVRTSQANIVGSACLQQYQWMITVTAAACFLLDHRLPDLHPENIWLNFSATSGVEEIAFRSGRFRALPGDSASEHADARIVAHMATLREQMRLDLEMHMTPVIHALQRRLGCNARRLWLTLADRCADNIVWLAQEQYPAIGMEAIRHELAPLFGSHQSLLCGRELRLFELSHLTYSRVYLERASCCYWYRQEGGDYCATCPHRTGKDRNEQLLKWMAERYEQSRGQTAEAAGIGLLQ